MTRRPGEQRVHVYLSSDSAPMEVGILKVRVEHMAKHPIANMR